MAAPHTGAGKTTVTIGLIAALRRRGLAVQPFKVGPDYIDPGFLSRAAGRLARNLDGWLLDAATVRWLFDRHAGAASVAVVEGMMGFFDGLTGSDDAGSTAHVARILELPVVVVLDASRGARSIAAVARGCQVFDRRARIAGWILNRVAGDTHRTWVAEAVERATRRPVLGALPEHPRLALPERYLGLVQAHEAASLRRVFAGLAHEVEERIDLDRLVRLTQGRAGKTRAAAPRRLERLLAAARGRTQAEKADRSVVAWARDDAFTFHYADNIELLTALGARVVPWSPLADRRLPDGTGALVLGGGYPELFVSALADNHAALQAVRAFAASGRPVYAECGGLIYLTRGIRPAAAAAGRRLAGVVPAWTRVHRRPRVAYVRAQMLRDTILAPRGTTVRGHEFHTSSLVPAARPAGAAYRVADASDLPPRLDGYCRAGVLASYVHVNFLSDPRMAARFVAQSRR